MPSKSTNQTAQDDPLDYEEYDIAFEDAAYEQAELLAKKRRKSKPKKASSNLIPGIVIRARGHHFDVQTDAGAGPGRARSCTPLRGASPATPRSDS